MKFGQARARHCHPCVLRQQYSLGCSFLVNSRVGSVQLHAEDPSCKLHHLPVTPLFIVRLDFTVRVSVGFRVAVTLPLGDLGMVSCAFVVRISSNINCL